MDSVARQCGTAAMLALVAGAVHPGRAPAQSSQITGVVQSAFDDAVLPNAVVTLNLSRSVVTDGTGRFAFSDVEFGTNILTVRRLGFELLEVLVHVPNDTTITLQVTLSPLPVTLEGVEVTADGESAVPHLAREGFYERRQAGFGKFLDRAAIEDLHVSYPSRLLERFPRRFREPCMLFVDGVRVDRSELDSRTLLQILNELVTVDHIEAIEVYAGVADVPARFNMTRGPGCPSPAVTVVWTR